MTDSRVSNNEAGKLAEALASDLNALIKQNVTVKTPEDLEQIEWPAATMKALGEIVNEFLQEVRTFRDSNTLRQREAYATAERTLAEDLRLLHQTRVTRPEVVSNVDTFVVTGRVVDQATGDGLPDVTVAVVDDERRFVDKLGSVITDGKGYYQITYNLAELHEVFDLQPRLSVEIRDPTDQPVALIQDALTPRSGTVAEINASVDGAKLPDSRARAALSAHLRERVIAQAESRLQAARNLARLKE